jgi:hypothetical protein
LIGVLVVSLGLAGAIALGIGGTWLGGTLLLRPHPPAWLIRYFPQHSSRWGTAPTQSLAAITAELTEQGQQAGTLLALASVSTDPNVAGLWLLPVLEIQTPCPEDCSRIVALRLYGEHRQTAEGPELQLLDQINIQAPIETTVMEPLSQAGLGRLTSTQALPLTALEPLAGESLPGAWLTLTGRWRQSGSPIRYGQVIHIDARALTVRSLMNWSSPPRQLPFWRDLDQQGLPELVVNQSVGLEPNFKAYTVEGLSSPLFALRLALIDLQEAAVNNPAQGPYNTALHLARQGLWNEAKRRLVSLKQQHANHWSDAAERQLSLIALHGELTQTQAARAWSQPSQKLLSLLIDGRWQLALGLVESGDVGWQRTVLPLLRQDTTGRLWRRITATLQVNPRQPEARLWGALLLLAQQDQATAATWLKQGKPGQRWVKQFTEIATQLNDPGAVVANRPGATAANRPVGSNGSDRAASPMIQGWAGTATALRGVQAGDWYSDATLALPTGQQWYQVRVNRGWVDGQWQALTPAESDAELWNRLGPSPTLQLLNPEENAAATITVAAIQQQGNQIQLLGIGPLGDSSGPWLAVSPGQFRSFQEIARQPFTMVYQRYPEALERLGPLLGLGEIPPAPEIEAGIEAGTVPGQGLTVRLLDLTGDGQAEIVVPPEAGGVAIVNGQGQILFQAQTGTVLVGGLLNRDGSHTLVTRGRGQYRFHNWSPQGQRFE